eukprot:gene1970-1992_t
MTNADNSCRTSDGKIRTTEWEDIQYKHGNRIGKYHT